jgi:hypothetical protein
MIGKLNGKWTKGEASRQNSEIKNYKVAAISSYSAFMNKLSPYILITVFVLLVSCSAERIRIDLLEKELNIKLPPTYEQLMNSTKGGVDYEINIELKFKTPELRQIVVQIKKSKYFVQVARQEEDSLLYQTINDYATINGIWKKTDRGYEFYKTNNKNEPVTATLDTIEQILNFNFVHL